MRSRSGRELKSWAELGRGDGGDGDEGGGGEGGGKGGGKGGEGGGAEVCEEPEKKATKSEIGLLPITSFSQTFLPKIGSVKEYSGTAQ